MIENVDQRVKHYLVKALVILKPAEKMYLRVSGVILALEEVVNSAVAYRHGVQGVSSLHFISTLAVQQHGHRESTEGILSATHRPARCTPSVNGQGSKES